MTEQQYLKMVGMSKKAALPGAKLEQMIVNTIDKDGRDREEVRQNEAISKASLGGGLQGAGVGLAAGVVGGGVLGVLLARLAKGRPAAQVWSGIGGGALGGVIGTVAGGAYGAGRTFAETQKEVL